jgi:hypothetical protein
VAAIASSEPKQTEQKKIEKSMQEEISKIKEIKQIDLGPSTDAKCSDSDIMRQGTLVLKSKDKTFSFKEQG